MRRGVGVLSVALLGLLPMVATGQQALVVTDDTGPTRFALPHLQSAEGLSPSLAPVLGTSSGHALAFDRLPADAYVSYRFIYAAFTTGADEKLVRAEGVPTKAGPWAAAATPMRFTSDELSQVPENVARTMHGVLSGADRQIYPAFLQIRIEYHHREPLNLEIPITQGC